MKKNGFAYLWLIVVLLFMYLPILLLALYSFTDATQVGQSGAFSLDNYKTLIEEEELRNMIAGTFLLAITVAFLSTILGTIGAIGRFYVGKKLGSTIEFFNRIPVVNADVVTGFSICVLFIVFLNMDKDTYIPLIAGQMALCTPFVYLSVLPRLVQMDKNHYEVAIDLGATPLKAMFSVTLRELIPGIIAGFATALTLSLDDYFITSYTKPAVFDTISTYVVNATRGSQTRIKTALWALSTIIFVVVVAAVVLMNLKTPKEENGNA
ncbi:MAG: ABC transporter permease subunit [Eubacterium sp.]|nr:ABC transporter permease subunit [Eubacterium sp.]